MSKIGFRVKHIEKNANNSVVNIPCDYQHALCIGATGSGKTASIILPALKDRIEKGHSIIAYIYKGHEDKKIKQLASESGRLSDVMEIGKPHGQYINLLSLLDSEAIKNVILSLLGGGNNKQLDSYWSLSGARLGVAIVEILRQMNKIQQLFDKNYNEIITFNHVTVELEINDKTKGVPYTYPTGELNFKTLVEITGDAKTTRCFFEGLDTYVKQVRDHLRKNIRVTTTYGTNIIADEYDINIDKNFLKQTIKEIIKLEEVIKHSGSFPVNIDNGEIGGNNGVLQVLNNALIGVANKDYINYNEFDLLQSMEDNAIILVDIEGLGKDIHGVLLESILSKLATRIRNGIPTPVSVFIDEANRVLSSDMDIHNDVLREANVELILAIQNEEQMIAKYGTVEWDAIRKNFKHNYIVNLNHTVSYNEHSSITVEPLLFDDYILKIAEYKYNKQNHILQILYDKFDIDNTLDFNFSIQYNIVLFEAESNIKLVSEDGTISYLEYMGVLLKKKYQKEMQKYERMKTPTITHLSL